MINENNAKQNQH